MRSPPSRMRRVGHLLMGLGALVGVLVALAISAGLGFAGVPWLVNVGLAKLGFLGSGGLLAAGAGAVRVAARREQRQLEASVSSTTPH